MAGGRIENQSSYLRVKSHLDEIVEQIRAKDIPLEQALDLYEEAVRLGNSCADLIDSTDFSIEELESAGVGDAAGESESGVADENKAADESGAADEAANEVLGNAEPTEDVPAGKNDDNSEALEAVDKHEDESETVESDISEHPDNLHDKSGDESDES